MDAGFGPTLFQCDLVFFFKFLFIDFEREREKHQFVFPLIYAFIS